MPPHADPYRSFAELANRAAAGRDYRVAARLRLRSPILILAPHGGRIEEGTSELAELVASVDHSLFTFEGLRPHGNRELHITSSRFDHPGCLALLARCAVAIAIHGCSGERQIYVGGLETRFIELLVDRLTAAGLPATTDAPPHLAGRDPMNVCNRGTRGRGAQLEITMDLRAPAERSRIAGAVRAAIADFLRAEQL